MIQITPQMRILVAVESVDFRKGIATADDLLRSCGQLQQTIQARLNFQDHISAPRFDEWGITHELEGVAQPLLSMQ